jgi:asparagine synthase (glutamine-hydrolysing)
MSVQFGRWHFAGKPVDPEYLRRAGCLLEPHGPHGEGSYAIGSVGILFGAFHTTKESVREIQPHVTSTQRVLAWDGRLDNREELIAQLRDSVSIESTDALIVAAAFERWNIRCFAKLAGDWALSIWDAKDRALLLAKDPIGTRPLYYALDRQQITWSTTLDPLVLLSPKPLVLDPEYLAGWLSAFPATHLTPYAGIHSVPPSSFVLVRPAQCSTTRYWNFDPQNIIRYRTDAEYEEHWLDHFRSAVRRRLRSSVPVLAELSGGMDSSSIVCMADAIVDQGLAGTSRLDTVSYYSESEPNWDERPYFTKVEQGRGRSGCHIHIASAGQSAFEFDRDRFAPTPNCRSHASRSQRQFAALLSSQGNRVLLSGIGGDEVMGGVPTPVPELADLLARGRCGSLARQLTAWALAKRRPWVHILADVAREFCPQALARLPEHLRPARWLDPDFVRKNGAALSGYRSRLKLFGALPSFQQSSNTLDALSRQLGCTQLSSDPPCEVRYPYLDRDLLEFMFAIPREQIVRPNERRSLMRRSLRHLVPEEILNRRRKAFIAQGPLVAISAALPEFTGMRHNLELSRLHLVDVEGLLGALRDAGRGLERSPALLMRAILLERWLRHLSHWGVLDASTPEFAFINEPALGTPLRPTDKLLS